MMDDRISGANMAENASEASPSETSCMFQGVVLRMCNINQDYVTLLLSCYVFHDIF